MPDVVMFKILSARKSAMIRHYCTAFALVNEEKPERGVTSDHAQTSQIRFLAPALDCACGVAANFIRNRHAKTASQMFQAASLYEGFITLRSMPPKSQNIEMRRAYEKY
jgi:hypothetical protein